MTVLDTTPAAVLVIAIGVLVTTGVYLLLERSLTRVLIGFILLGNGINLLLLVAGGRAGGAPVLGTTPPWQMSDPLVQAMILTAIVITLGLTAFVLAMAYRSWQLHGHDEVQDDVEDRRIAQLAALDELAVEGSDMAGGAETLDEEAAEARDETDEGAPAREVHP